jgi:2-methylcitrate dehydratase PrpD
MNRKDYQKRLQELRKSKAYQDWNADQTEMIRRIIVDTGAVSEGRVNDKRTDAEASDSGNDVSK